MSSRDRPFLAPGEGSIRDPVECFTKSPLILSFSPRGEGTPELPAARILASSLPLGSETE